MAIIRYNGIDGVEPGYQLLGFTGHDGTIHLYPMGVSEGHTGAG